MNYNPFISQPVAGSSSSSLPFQQDTSRRVPGSPPPYSPEPPDQAPSSPFLVKRSSSTPHLNSPPLPIAGLSTYSHSQDNSPRLASSALYGHSAPRPRASYSREETDDDTDEVTSGDDTVMHRSLRSTPPGSLRERLFGNSKDRADYVERTRLISTTRGVRGAGETETEGEDATVGMHALPVTLNRPDSPFFLLISCAGPANLRSVLKFHSDPAPTALQPAYRASNNDTVWSIFAFSFVRVDDDTVSFPSP
ncbi:hypothetical protein BDY19DRAFT_997630 [Irpex rosettiformis]|uniref:Uncharacterized protein n=1 Tax=Irpex rosettiformis TaxID=378272 RepID=A0ACB8TR92_9APHY|nr:hypothetical protein BDY19DRAFT_997630 [Irpex rosettiformis]